LIFTIAVFGLVEMNFFFQEKASSRWSPELGLRPDSRFVPIPCF
jgi:hypothetical protein